LIKIPAKNPEKIKGYSAVDQEEMLIPSILSMLGIGQEHEINE
jgi:hypothetical protein